MAHDDETRDDRTAQHWWSGWVPSHGEQPAGGEAPGAGEGAARPGNGGPQASAGAHEPGAPQGAGAGAWPPPPEYGPWAGGGQWPPAGPQASGYHDPWSGYHAGSQSYGPHGYGPQGYGYPVQSGGPGAGGWPPPRQRHKGAVAALLAAGALVIGGAGVAVGVGLGGSSSSPQATSPAVGNSGGSVSPNSGNSGNGVAPSFRTGSGGGGSVYTSSGSPANVSSIAAKVDRGLVDINTQLAYQNQQAAGTGMVVTSSGEVITNNHVIEGATAISVTDLGNGRTSRATVVGYNRTADIAVLQLRHASGLATVKLGNSSSVRTGQGIVGIGNAGGVGGTPSVAGGSVTAVGQSIRASDAGNGTTETLSGLIQTNADIQPGDSGGPLVNANGQVVGMDTAASSNGMFTFQTPSTSGTQGFAIPVNHFAAVARQIEAGRSSANVHIGATPFLGVEVTTPTVLYQGNAGNGLGGFGGFGGFGNSGSSGATGSAAPPTTSGAAIASVFPGTSAATAGLSAGDIIIGLDGTSVTSPANLTQDLLGLHPGQRVSLAFVNPRGQHQSVGLTLKAGPPQ